MKTDSGFFVVELMVGFFLVQLIVASAAGYFGQQARTYHHCMQRLQAVERAQDELERCWAMQQSPKARTIDGYTYSYEPLPIPTVQKNRVGLCIITYGDAAKPERIAYVCARMDMEHI